jgi:hypothetical protein
MKVVDLVKRLDELVELGNDVLRTQYREEGYSFFEVKSAPMAGFRSASLSFIDRVYGSKHPHFNEFTQKTSTNYASDAERGIAILSAIRSEIAGGWLFTFKGLVASELFSDFLEMAEHLLDNGFKDPAAVMIGSVLEEHLRQLCLKHSITIEDEKDSRIIPRKADLLNADIAKANVYTKLDQKQITAWLDLRNKAAHGKYNDYTAEQVRQFLGGVTDFMVRIKL